MQRLFTVRTPAIVCRRVKAESLDEAYAILRKWIDEHRLVPIDKATCVMPDDPPPLSAASSRPTPPREDIPPMPPDQLRRTDGKSAAAGKE